MNINSIEVGDQVLCKNQWMTVVEFYEIYDPEGIIPAFVNEQDRVYRLSWVDKHKSQRLPECCSCSKDLEPISRKDFQAYESCEIKIVSAFGSRFDPLSRHNASSYELRGYICDDCVEPLIENLEEQCQT